MFWRAVVRTDPLKGEEIRSSEPFEIASLRSHQQLTEDTWGKNSLSGHEPNRFFLSQASKQFHDLSSLSGADHLGDGRAVVLWDFDRNGWPDLASVNANAPKLTVHRNEIHRLKLNGGSFVAFRLVGGNRRSESSTEWSNRDGIGARLELTTGDGLQRQLALQAGEGFSAQNSKTLLVGLGAADVVQHLQVHWPSGKRQEWKDLPAGKLVRLFENPADSPSGEGAVVEEYR